MTHVVRVDMDRVPLLADKPPSNQDGNDEEDEEPGINIGTISSYNDGIIPMAVELLH